MGWDGMVQGGEGTGGEEKTVRVSFGVWQRHQKRKERDVIKGNGGMEWNDGEGEGSSVGLQYMMNICNLCIGFGREMEEK